MQVTSDTLFHFTTSLKNLKDILSKKFLLTYCHEKYLLDYETHDSYYPMVTFCDIPLSLAKDHIEKYGSYAIGMTKEWGIKNNLNPVVYIEKDSLLAKDIQATTDNLIKTSSPILDILEKVRALIHETTKSVVDLTANAKVLTSEKEPFLTIELQKLKEKLESMIIIPYIKVMSNSIIRTANHSINLFRYIKNYKGTLIRKDKIFNDYRFYDEREWRYVPALSDARVKIY